MAEFEDELPLPSFADFCSTLLINKNNCKRVMGVSSSNAQISKVGKKKENEYSPSLVRNDRKGDNKVEDCPQQHVPDETTGRWTAEEHRLFLEGIMRYGKDWKKMQPLIKTRSLVQIRTHAQKVFKKIRQKGDNVPGSALPNLPLRLNMTTAPAAVPFAAPAVVPASVPDGINTAATATPDTTSSNTDTAVDANSIHLQSDNIYVP